MATWLGVVLILQAQATASLPPPPSMVASTPVAETSARATLAPAPPVLDGVDDEPVWQAAPIIDRFLQAKPSEGAAARFETAARVMYDADHLYVFVRAFDPHPDSIVSLLSRRDEQTASDEIIIMLDPYHDRRTGYEFVVNPVGREVRLRDLQRRQRGRRLGRRMGRRDPDRLARLDRRVPDPALPAPLLGQGTRHASAS